MPLNPKLPDKLDSGPGFLKRVVNSIRAFAIENRITTVTVREKVGTEQVSGQLKPFANGSGVNLELIVGGGGSSSTAAFPFQLVDASTHDDGAQVRVRYGTVNSMIPDGMVAGDHPPLIESVSDGDFIFLHASWDTALAAIASLEIVSDTSIPADDTGSDGEYYLQIGSVSVDTMPDIPVVTIAQSIQTSQVLSVCRDWFSDPATYGASWGPA